jgi:hypothetical protein
MEASIISALAALTGTAVGRLTSVAANWLNHRGQIRAQWLHQERSRRQILYRDFIEEASKCYIDALQHHEADADIPGLVGLYAKLGRMRVLSSKPVVHCAEHIAKKIMDTYLEPDKSFVELRDMARREPSTLLREFSDACRDEFEQMRAQQF